MRFFTESSYRRRGYVCDAVSWPMIRQKDVRQLGQKVTRPSGMTRLTGEVTWLASQLLEWLPKSRKGILRSN